MSSLPRELVERMEVLAEDDAFNTLIDILVEKYSEEWRATPPEDASRREQLYRQMKAAEGLRSEVRNIAKSDQITVWNRGLQNKTKWSTI